MTQPKDVPPIGVVEVIVTETIDAMSAPRLAASLAEAIYLQPGQLVVDLAACPRMDAAAIAVLMEAHRRMRRNGGYLTLRGPSERLRRNLLLAHTGHVLTVEPAAADAA